MQSWARDNTIATMWPCFQVQKLLLVFYSIFAVANPFMHRVVNIFQNVVCPWNSNMLSRSEQRCCVSSSVFSSISLFLQYAKSCGHLKTSFYRITVFICGKQDKIWLCSHLSGQCWNMSTVHIHILYTVTFALVAFQLRSGAYRIVCLVPLTTLLNKC